MNKQENNSNINIIEETNKKTKDIDGKFDDMGNACCSGDCTGLIQITDPDEYETASYKEIFDFGVPAVDDTDDQGGNKQQ